MERAQGPPGTSQQLSSTESLGDTEALRGSCHTQLCRPEWGLAAVGVSPGGCPRSFGASGHCPITVVRRLQQLQHPPHLGGESG